MSTGWVKIKGADSAPIRASLMSEKKTINCVGTVTARRGCWSFLKGGFVLDEPLDYSLLFFQVIKDIKNQIDTGTNEESGYKMR